MNRRIAALLGITIMISATLWPLIYSIAGSGLECTYWSYPRDKMGFVDTCIGRYPCTGGCIVIAAPDGYYCLPCEHESCGCNAQGTIEVSLNTGDCMVGGPPPLLDPCFCDYTSGGPWERHFVPICVYD
jgi:hypothetical protein